MELLQFLNRCRTLGTTAQHMETKRLKSISKTGKKTETKNTETTPTAACLHTTWPNDATDTGRNGAAAAACTLWEAGRGGAFECSVARAWGGLEVGGGGAEAS